MDETKVGIYVRLSRDDARYGESMSIENQRLMLTDYCDRMGWQIVDVYADDGFTGLNFERPEMQRLIADAKSGRINTILCKDLSRFGRNYVEAGQLIEDLFPTLNIRLVAPNDGVDTLQNRNTDFIPIRNVFNEYYSRDISRKVISARRASAKQGNFQGGAAPYGYKLDPNDKHHLLIDDKSAEVVRRIFTMRVDGKGVVQIADALNTDRILCPRDYYYHCKGKLNPRMNETHKWIDTTVTHILKNEVYIGHMVQFKTGRVSFKNRKTVNKPKESQVRCENTHEPIIDMETWEIVQKSFEKYAGKGRVKERKNGEMPLFSALLVCADCGSKMDFRTGEYINKKGQPRGQNYYTCRANKSSGSSVCTSHLIGEKDLKGLAESELAAFADEISVDEQGLRYRLIAQRTKAVKAEQEALKKKAANIQNRLADLDKMLERLYEELLLGQIPRETLMDMSNRYNSEKEEKKAELAEINAKLEEYINACDDVEKWLDMLKKYMQGQALDHTLIHKLIKRITVGEAKKIDGMKTQPIEIEYTF